MKRRELFKSLFVATALTGVGATSELVRASTSKPKLYQWTLTYKFATKMTLEEYREKELEWQKSLTIGHINTEYKNSKKLLDMKFEFYETFCLCRYLFDSEESFNAWYGDIQKHSVIDKPKRNRVISEITWAGTYIEIA